MKNKLSTCDIEQSIEKNLPPFAEEKSERFCFRDYRFSLGEPENLSFHVKRKVLGRLNSLQSSFPDFS